MIKRCCCKSKLLRNRQRLNTYISSSVRYPRGGWKLPWTLQTHAMIDMSSRSSLMKILHLAPMKLACFISPTLDVAFTCAWRPSFNTWGGTVRKRIAKKNQMGECHLRYGIQTRSLCLESSKLFLQIPIQLLHIDQLTLVVRLLHRLLLDAHLTLLPFVGSNNDNQRHLIPLDSVPLCRCFGFRLVKVLGLSSSHVSGIGSSCAPSATHLQTC